MINLGKPPRPYRLGEGGSDDGAEKSKKGKCTHLQKTWKAAQLTVGENPEKGSTIPMRGGTTNCHRH